MCIHWIDILMGLFNWSYQNKGCIIEFNNSQLTIYICRLSWCVSEYEWRERKHRDFYMICSCSTLNGCKWLVFVEKREQMCNWVVSLAYVKMLVNENCQYRVGWKWEFVSRRGWVGVHSGIINSIRLFYMDLFWRLIKNVYKNVYKGVKTNQFFSRINSFLPIFASLRLRILGWAEDERLKD